MGNALLMNRSLLSLCYIGFWIALPDQSASFPASVSRQSTEGPLPEITKQSLQWEKQQWADGSVLDNAFYSAPNGSLDAAPGTLLRLERQTNASLFSLPPATAISRFIYQSQTLNGSLVPVSAYILWPYSPRSSEDGYQVVAWSHGTSGQAPNCAPSHIIHLWQHYLAPYQLAQQGYVVVGTDYAGLGVAKTLSGRSIVHEYLASPAHANDVFYSVQAAQAAFPQLGKQFIVTGHSQGGGSAWAAAQRQARDPVEGYLGAYVGSPVTKILDFPEARLPLIGVRMLAGILANFPELKPGDVLTADGQQRYAQVQALGACSATTLTILSNIELFQPNWTQNPWVQKYFSLIANGGQPIAGPMLVTHGEADQMHAINSVDRTVNETLGRFPTAQLEYVRMPGVDHISTLTGSQHIWMDWIADRFAGKPAAASGIATEPQTPVQVSQYQMEHTWYISLARIFYQVP